MRIPKRLGEARKLLKENLPSTEELIQQKLEEFRNLDVQGIVRKQDRFDEITKGLNEEEKAAFEDKFEDLAEENTGIIHALADALEDPKIRDQIIEELKIRVRGS